MNFKESPIRTSSGDAMAASLGMTAVGGSINKVPGQFGTNKEFKQPAIPPEGKAVGSVPDPTVFYVPIAGKKERLAYLRALELYLRIEHEKVCAQITKEQKP